MCIAIKQYEAIGISIPLELETFLHFYSLISIKTYFKNEERLESHSNNVVNVMIYGYIHDICGNVAIK